MPEDGMVQLCPPSLVFKIALDAPTAHPVYESTKCKRVKADVDPVFMRIQVSPPSTVRCMDVVPEQFPIPAACPQTNPVSRSVKKISLIAPL